jgi:hypothetical protein
MTVRRKKCHHAPKARRDLVQSPPRFRFLIEHDLFGKQVTTFPDHALEADRARRKGFLDRLLDPVQCNGRNSGDHDGGRASE